MKTKPKQHPLLSAIVFSPFALTLLLPMALLAGLGTTLASAGETKTVFVPSGTNEFAFDTGVLRGTLRAKGRSMGLSSVVHLPSGTTLDRSMGLFSHYRLFSANQRHGTAGWDWPSTARLQPNGSVEVDWPAAADRPFELRAIYRWAAPNTLDLETTVKPQIKLAHFESFLACYFQTNFTNSLVYVSEAPDRSGNAGFMAAEQKHGTWQAFPRDAAAAALVQDGRWKFPPNPVDWVTMPRLAKPLSIRRDPASGLTAVLMSPPEDCFAISTPYQTEGHRSMYLSLFGRDLNPGEQARARTRLVILSKPSDAEILRAYESYLKQCKN